MSSSNSYGSDLLFRWTLSTSNWKIKQKVYIWSYYLQMAANIGIKWQDYPWYQTFLGQMRMNELVKKLSISVEMHPTPCHWTLLWDSSSQFISVCSVMILH
jgi:aspartate/tyrosine/aromatic aminotransferase